MALLTKRRRGTRFRKAPEAQEAQAPRPPRRHRRRLLTVALLLGALLWFLPAMVAHTPVLTWIVNQATADLHGTVSVGSASLGWLAPIAARDIEIHDVQGKPVLKVPKLAGDKSLAAILWNLSKLGQFRLEQPKLNVVLRAEGSNLEDVLANYLVPREEPSQVGVVLQIVDGTVSVTDSGSSRTWQIEELQLSLTTSAQTNAPLKLEVSATIADAQHPGRLAVELTMQQHETTDGAAESTGELSIESGDVPLAMLQSVFGRFAPQTQLSGRLGGKIHTLWNGEAAAGKTRVEADVTGRDLLLSTPQLGTDRVQLDALRAACRITRQEERLEIEQSSVDCDLGSVSLSGTLGLGDRESESLWASVLQQTCEIDGRIDLARLAQMLPDTLRVRKETRITSGQVQVALSSSRTRQGPNTEEPDTEEPGAEPPDSQGMVWRGRIEVGNLKAVYRERQLAWNEPILITLAAYEGPQGPVVENLKCESDFLKLHAAGTPDELAASASFDLKQLADQLGQFVDLDGISLGGDGWAHFNWKRSEQQKFETDAELQLRDFQLALPQQPPWTEENLLLFFSAAGRTDLGADTQLDAASLEIKTSTDQIQATLTQPVLEFDGDGSWSVNLQAKGQLQAWPARLGTWITVDAWQPAGAYELDAQVTASTDRIAVARARLTVEQLRLAGPSLKVEEPTAELALAGNWDLRQRRLQMEPLSLTSSSLWVRADRVVLDMPRNGSPKITADMKYRGNLQRLQRWTADPKAKQSWWIAGLFSGTAKLAHSQGLTDTQLDAEVANLAVIFSSGERFQEPTVQLAARGSYAHQTKILRLENLDLACGTLAARTTGQIAQAKDQTDVQLTGQIQYDWERLGELLRPYVGPGVRIVGRGTSPASYRGPLALVGARANAGVGWQRADAYGFQVGLGELKAVLADGIVQAEPLDLAVNGGRLMLTPRVRLAPEPIELTLPPGPLAQQVEITPAMCASALKYIAPVLADVSTAQGSFSVDLEGCRIPLADPAQGELAGRFTIHSVQVGPGPLIREMAILMGRAAPAKLRRESVVPFRMVGGRVYHQGLELIFPELTIRTYGSVGLDQTLAIVAEMPVPPKWLGNNTLGAALRNQTIQLPIGGTLSKPKIDRREADRLSRQFIENAARNVIEDELGRQLDRLLGPPQ